MIRQVVPERLEILYFASTDYSYTAFLEGDRRLDVARCQNFQAEDGRLAYLWIQSLQGYFLARQDLGQGRQAGWELLLEVVPEEPSSQFFSWVEEHFFRLLAEWEGEGSLPALGMTPDGE